jgi:hypothetical protein
MTTTETTTIAAKVTDYRLNEPVVPPDFWTVDLDGRELDVYTEYDQGDLRLTAVWDAETREELLNVFGHSISDELRDAIQDTILAKIESFNLELLADIVRAIMRDTSRAHGYGHGGILDNWREVPTDERIERDRDRPAPALEAQAKAAAAQRIIGEKLASGELKGAPSGGLIKG